MADTAIGVKWHVFDEVEAEHLPSIGFLFQAVNFAECKHQSSSVKMGIPLFLRLAHVLTFVCGPSNILMSALNKI